MAITGDIADRVKGILPVSWDALLTDPVPEGTGNVFGEDRMQEKIDLIKEKVFGEVVDPDDEGTTYTRRQLDFAAKCIAIEIIPAAIDFWRSKPISKALTGKPNETVTWEARLNNLRQQRIDLMAEVAALEGEVLDSPILKKTGIPGFAPDQDLLTPDPWQFPAPFAQR